MSQVPSGWYALMAITTWHWPGSPGRSQSSATPLAWPGRGIAVVSRGRPARFGVEAATRPAGSTTWTPSRSRTSSTSVNWPRLIEQEHRHGLAEHFVRPDVDGLVAQGVQHDGC